MPVGRSSAWIYNTFYLVDYESILIVFIRKLKW